jgi:hypothetical protein
MIINELGLNINYPFNGSNSSSSTAFIKEATLTISKKHDHTNYTTQAEGSVFYNGAWLHSVVVNGDIVTVIFESKYSVKIPTGYRYNLRKTKFIVDRTTINTYGDIIADDGISVLSVADLDKLGQGDVYFSNNEKELMTHCVRFISGVAGTITFVNMDDNIRGTVLRKAEGAVHMEDGINVDLYANYGSLSIDGAAGNGEHPAGSVDNNAYVQSINRILPDDNGLIRLNSSSSILLHQSVGAIKIEDTKHDKSL